MKLNCNVVYDLLPLYVDEICSEDSKKLVEEHLEECEACKKKCKDMKGVIIEEENKGELKENEEQIIKDFSLKHAFTKMRRICIITIVVATLIGVPAVNLGINQYKGDGISYTNIDEILTMRAFLKAVKESDFEKAFSYIDIKYYYDQTKPENGGEETLDLNSFQLVITAEGPSYYTNGSITVFEENWISFQETIQAIKDNKEQQEFRERWYAQFVDMTYDDFYQYAKEVFVSSMKEWKMSGAEITGYHLNHIYRANDWEGPGKLAYQMSYYVDIINGQESTTDSGIIMTSHQSGQLIFAGGFGVSDLHYDLMSAIRVYESLEE